MELFIVLVLAVLGLGYFYWVRTQKNKSTESSTVSAVQPTVVLPVVVEAAIIEPKPDEKLKPKKITRAKKGPAAPLEKKTPATKKPKMKIVK